MAELSVIIPLYNKQDSIYQTISSVLKQSFSDFELLVIDDGSTDNSLEIVESLSDARIRVICKDNEGVSATRNRGAEEASAELLFFLDADDLIYEDCLETLMKLYYDYPDAEAWTANYKMVKSKSVVTALADLPRGYVHDVDKMIWLRKWNFRMGSFICSRESFLHCGGFPENICVYEDFMMIDKFIHEYECVYDSKAVMSYVFESRKLSKSHQPIGNRAEDNFIFTGVTGFRKLIYGEKLGVLIIRCIVDWNLKDLVSLVKKYKFITLFSIYALGLVIIRNLVNYKEIKNKYGE